VGRLPLSVMVPNLSGGHHFADAHDLLRRMRLGGLVGAAYAHLLAGVVRGLRASHPDPL